MLVRSHSLRPQITLGFLLLALSTPLLAQPPGQQSPHGAGPFRIAGTIISATEGHPLSRARVSLQDVKNRQNQVFMITGDDGHFEFATLPAGKYSLDGAKRGYITAAYNEHEQLSTAIVTGAGLDTESLTLRLAPTATITGHVLDEFGEPVRTVNVTLWRDDHSAGISRTVRFRSDMSDDQGLFEFAPLDAGTYFVSVVAKPWYAVHPPSIHQADAPEVSVDRSLDVVYLPTYYSGATEVEDASPVLIRGGDHFDVDLRLTPVPAMHVIVRQPVTEGEHTFSYPMLSKRDFDGPQYGVQPDVQMTSPGVFEIVAAPGRYELAFANNVEPRRTTEVDISQDNQELDVSAGQAISNITAKVEVSGETTFPQRMGIGLRNAQGRVVAWQPVNTHHEVSFSDIIPGKYDVLAGTGPRAFSVIRMTLNSAAASGHSLTVPPGSTMDISLSLVGGAAAINGLAEHNGKGTSGAMVVLVPKNPEANREMFRRDQSDLDGTFTFRSVIPGTYTVIAIADGWDLDWSKPAVIARYAAHGQKLVVGEGSQTAVQLLNPVEIQPK